MLYPAELQAPIELQSPSDQAEEPRVTVLYHQDEKRKNLRLANAGRRFGAGDGNRTHTTSLEGWGSTTELHPRIIAA